MGGSQLVSRRVAKALGSRVVLGSPVRRIDQRRRHVVVESDRVHVAGALLRGHGAAGPGRPDRVPPRSPGAARPAHAADADGLGAQVPCDLRQAVLARRRAHRPGHERHGPGEGHLRQLASHRREGRAARLHRGRGGARVEPAAGGQAQGGGARAVRPLVRRRGALAAGPTWSRTGWRRRGAAAATAPGRPPACCSTTARRSRRRWAASTGPAPRPPPSGAATWTARCAPASAWPPRLRQAPLGRVHLGHEGAPGRARARSSVVASVIEARSRMRASNWLERRAADHGVAGHARPGGSAWPPRPRSCRCRLCSSRLPSPVTTKAAARISSSKPRASSTKAAPGTSVRPACGPEASGEAAGGARHRHAAWDRAASRPASSASRRSRRATVAASAPFWGANTRGGVLERRAHVAHHLDLRRDTRRVAGPRARRRRRRWWRSRPPSPPRAPRPPPRRRRSARRCRGCSPARRRAPSSATSPSPLA